MAPPSKRRPGFSRRAQYGLFLGYVIAVGGIMIAVLLLIISMLDPRGFSALKGVALDATAPVSMAGRSVVRGVTDGGATISNYFTAASQNAGLKRQIEASQQKLLEADAIILENRRLKNLLKLSDQMTDEIATARIVGSTFASGRQFATLSAGSARGIAIGQPVRAPEGLIGRVLETGRHAARILLITDGASNVPVKLLRDGTPALATGRGDGLIDIKPLEVGANNFRHHDIFVTSGTGGIYPPNIPVAVVASVTPDDTIARPLANPARIDFAIVERIYQPAADQPVSDATNGPGALP
jgi:rod shape-determining protein MreC